ncbi:hypothetical protein E3N88_33150 [Mikania micrantha]|uniref:Uncharacterized protein n=1 Tax=Mikania micrantha TaxID=192012 RepID=A0A5N6MAL9_9ASTR|nr:hypothetical protein E3N88_33150 [Mikania micrantha]
MVVIRWTAGEVNPQQSHSVNSTLVAGEVKFAVADCNSIASIITSTGISTPQSSNTEKIEDISFKYWSYRGRDVLHVVACEDPFNVSLLRLTQKSIDPISMYFDASNIRGHSKILHVEVMRK